MCEKFKEKMGMGWKCKRQKEIKIIFCHPTSIWVFKVPDSGEQVHSLIHMTEAEFLKVDVEQVKSLCSKVFLHFERLKLYITLCKILSIGDILIGSFKAL